MKDVGIFYGHLVHITVFCCILWTFCIVRGNLVLFYPFWYFVPRKILASLPTTTATTTGTKNQPHFFRQLNEGHFFALKAF
jgi:hypothetical protein